MCPEHAGVVIIDDETENLADISQCLQQEGHQVIGEYQSFVAVKEALENKTFPFGLVQVIIADAAAGRNPLGAPAIREIRAAADELGIKMAYVIGNSSMYPVEGANINNIGKDLSALPKLVTAAPDVLK